MTPPPPDPHAHQPLLTAGPTPQRASLTLILLHGRGSSAHDILSLHHALALDHISYLAPQAANHTWYPHSFLSPIPSNQPYLDSALSKIESLVNDLLSRNIPSDRIALLGFSQGACLATEFVARHPRRYAALIALSGGLIGPPSTPRTYPGSLAGTPVLLASADPDPHVPFDRIRETDLTLTRMSAAVDLRRYPNLPHTINQDELQATRHLLSQLTHPPK